MRKFQLKAIVSSLLLCHVSAIIFNIDALVERANIYFQKPLRLGGPTELVLRDIEQVEVNEKKVIKIIVHGFTGNRRHFSIAPLGNAYMGAGADNVLLADWADAAGLDYHSSRKAVVKVGQYFGRILNDFFMSVFCEHSGRPSKHNIDQKNVHIIGHSLGAHIAGIIGRYFNGNLGRITGLDPALPLFTPHSDDALRATDAQFVDVVHTDYPVFGDITPRGTVDFYPTFGYSPQPGCDVLDFVAASKLIFESYSCSHNRAVLLYAESIGLPANLPAKRCSLNYIKSRNFEACVEKTNATSSSDNVVNYLGEAASKSLNGTFYLETYDAPPFGKGFNSNYI